MKNFISIAVLTLLLSSCTKEYHEEYNVNTYTQTFKVNSDDWKEYSDKSGYYYFYEFREDKITDDVLIYGVKVAYLRYVMNDVTILSPLPFSDFVIDSKTGIKREEQLTVEFNPGHITFILKMDDHGRRPPFYPDYEFQVNILW